MTMSNNRRALVAFVVLALLTAFVVIFAMQREATAADGYSTDPENPTLVEEVPEGFTALGDPTSVTEDCITTTEQVYSRTTSGAEAEYTPWSEWIETQSGLLAEPTVPANTDVHEWRVTGPVKVVDSPATEGYWTEWTDSGEPIRTEENAAPTGSDTVRYLPLGPTEVEIVTPGQHYSLVGGSWPNDGTQPGFPETGDPDGRIRWQANTAQEPHDNGEGDPATWVGTEGVGLHYTSNENSGHSDWFYYQPPVTDVDYLWQKQVREWVPGSEEQSHMEWGVEERTRTLIPGEEDVTEYVYTSVTTGEECEPEEPEEPENPDEPKEPKEPRQPQEPTVPTSINAGL